MIGLGPDSPYTRRDWVVATNCAAFLAWAYYAAKFYVITGNLGGLPFVALYGLPFALAATWATGGPVLRWLLRRPVSWIGAAAWGAGIAGLMALVWFGVTSLQRWHASVNNNFHYQIGGGDFVRDVDGILTPYGWWVEFTQTLEFVLLGVGVALTVRAIIGKGRETVVL